MPGNRRAAEPVPLHGPGEPRGPPGQQKGQWLLLPPRYIFAAHLIPAEIRSLVKQGHLKDI